MSLTVQTSSCCWFYTRGRGHRVRHVTWHRSANRITFDGCLSSPLFWNAGRHVASVNQCLIDVSLSALRLSHHVGSDPVLLFCCQLKKKKRSPLSGVSPWAQNNLRLWHGEQRQDKVWTLFSSHGSAGCSGRVLLVHDPLHGVSAGPVSTTDSRDSADVHGEQLIKTGSRRVNGEVCLCCPGWLWICRSWEEPSHWARTRLISYLLTDTDLIWHDPVLMFCSAPVCIQSPQV